MAIPYFSRGEVARSRNRVVPARNSLPGGHPFNLLLAPALGRHRFHGSEVGELLARIRHQTVPRIPMVCVRAPYFPEPSMTKLKGLMACARVASLTLAACPGSGFAAADLRLGPGAPPAIADGAMAHGYAGFFIQRAIRGAALSLCRKPVFTAKRRGCGRRRSASRKGFMRIQSCFRNRNLAQLLCRASIVETPP
jgi:hypothetical protein